MASQETSLQNIATIPVDTGITVGDLANFGTEAITLIIQTTAEEATSKATNSLTFSWLKAKTFRQRETEGEYSFVQNVVYFRSSDSNQVFLNFKQYNAPIAVFPESEDSWGIPLGISQSHNLNRQEFDRILRHKGGILDTRGRFSGRNDM